MKNFASSWLFTRIILPALFICLQERSSAFVPCICEEVKESTQVLVNIMYVAIISFGKNYSHNTGTIFRIKALVIVVCGCDLVMLTPNILST